MAWNVHIPTRRAAFRGGAWRGHTFIQVMLSLLDTGLELLLGTLGVQAFIHKSIN